MTIDHRLVKLGKKPAVEWPLKFATYAKDALLPDPPAEFSNSRGVTNWGMLYNDVLGCCVIASKFHHLQSFILSQILDSVAQSLIGVIHPSDDLVIDYYSQWGGYVPGDASTDNGMDETTALRDWVTQGLAKYQLLAFADPDPQNLVHIKQGVVLFGGVDIGLQLPVAWQNAPIWDKVNDDSPGSWGAHDVTVVDYDEQGPTVVTWGALQEMTWAGFTWACDEAHILVGQDFAPRDGFDLQTLQADLAAVRS